jgi:glycolate oxidase FAD binding subunit
LQQVLAESADAPAYAPIGGGTAPGFGAPLARPALEIDTTGLDRVIDHPWADMTITAEAGLSIRRLQAILGEHGQTLPVDVPGLVPRAWLERRHPAAEGSTEPQPPAASDGPTIGGILAANASGPRSFAYGSLRDWLIGVDVVDGSGRRIHGGGRVVKNVAGYDLMKLHTGALGALGIIVQATFKVKPKPQAATTLTFPIPEARIHELNRFPNRSATRPTAIVWVDDPRSPFSGSDSSADGRPAVGLGLITFEETEVGVRWQVEEAKRELAEINVSEIDTHEGFEVSAGLLQRLTDRTADPEAPLILKLTVLPNALRVAAEAIRSRFADVSLMAWAASGVWWCRMTEPDDSVSRIESLRAALAEVNGSVLIRRGSERLRRLARTWSVSAGEAGIIRALKRKLDPADRLNPGRWITPDPVGGFAP